jgi:WD40 repeat protein
VNHTFPVEVVQWSPDGSLFASGSHDQTVCIWQVNQDDTTREISVTPARESWLQVTLAGTLRGHASWVYSVAWSSDGRLLATGSLDSTVRVWDLDAVVTPTTSKSELVCIAEHMEPVLCVALSLDGQHAVSGSCDSSVCIWDAATGMQVMGPLEGQTSSVTSVAWSRNGKHVASGSCDRIVRICDTATGMEKLCLIGHEGEVKHVVWSPDSKYLASCSSDLSIRIWDVSTGKEAIAPLMGHEEVINCVAWSPDCRYLASGSGVSYSESDICGPFPVRMWDVATGKEVMEPMRGHTRDHES